MTKPIYIHNDLKVVVWKLEEFFGNLKVCFSYIVGDGIIGPEDICFCSEDCWYSEFSLNGEVIRLKYEFI